MVSIIQRFADRKSQSEKRPAVSKEFIGSVLKRPTVLERSALDLKKFALWNNSLKHQDTSTASTQQTAIESSRRNSVFDDVQQTLVYRYSSKCSGRTGACVDTQKFGIPWTECKPSSSELVERNSEFDVDSTAPFQSTSTVISDVIFRRNSCTARIHVSSPFHSLNQRRISQTEVATIDDSHMKRLLGAGGFGSVYMAVLNSKRVAVKKFHSKTKNERAKAESFNAELQAKTLRHPNIVRVFGTSSLENMRCVIMEYTGDMNLQQILNDSDQHLTLSRRLCYALDIVSALEFIHDNNLVHLDVKPTNILVTPYDMCKLGDFGCCQVRYSRVNPNKTGGVFVTCSYSDFIS